MSNDADKTSTALLRAIECLQGKSTLTHDPGLALALLRNLMDLNSSSPVEARIHHYCYGDQVLADGIWHGEMGESYPTGTTFIGIVLDKVLEVSVVEELESKRVYHRPMAVLYPGMLFGLFEIADFRCGALSQQDYTVYAGARTFFFKDPKLDEGCGTFVGGALARLTQKPAPFNLKRNQKTQPDYNKWIENRGGYEKALERYSPTQLPFMTLESVVGTRPDWRAQLLLVAVSNHLVERLGTELRESLFCEAWSQSAHLRRTAISAYSSDEVSAKLHSVPSPVLSGVAREIQALGAVMADQRPGFQCLTNPAYCQYGPYNDFFAELERLRKEGERKFSKDSHVKSFVRATFSDGVYVPAFRFDHYAGGSIVPIFPNCYPSYKGTSKKDERKRAEEAGRVPFHEHSAAWFPSEADPYADDCVKWHSAESGDEGTDEAEVEKVSFLRTYAEVSTSPSRLRAFLKVPGDLSTVAGLIGVQHLMEETVCLINELIEHRKITAESIWLLGKPYSSNFRIAHRLRRMGVNVVLPEPTWDQGEFDAWFEEEAKSFFSIALEAVRAKRSGLTRILLLDDGGALIRTASASKVSKDVAFLGVEQTSRGIEAAKAAAKKFPIVPVACCALKSVVEPEFVARAAVSKLAKAYPEALRASRVGVMGLGNIGRYLCDYLIRRPDIAVQGVLGFDKDQGRKNDLPSAVTFVSEAKDLFGKDGVDVLFCCTGTDLSKTLRTARPTKMVICISLSSGDVEFGELLRSADKVSPYGIVTAGNFRIASGGFPVTFDRETVSAPVFEMQITRALLLAGMVEVASSSQDKGMLQLSHGVQWKIWSQWLEEAAGKGTANSAIRRWQEQRSREGLRSIDSLVKSEQSLKELNEEFFRLRTSGG